MTRVLTLPILPPILAAPLLIAPHLLSGLGQAHVREEYSADICTNYFCGRELATLAMFGRIFPGVLMNSVTEFK